jgi:hypothetical protein
MLNKSTTIPQNKMVEKSVSAENFTSTKSNDIYVKPQPRGVYFKKSLHPSGSKIAEKRLAKPADSSSTSLSAMLANRAQSLDIASAAAPTNNKTFTGVITDATGHALAGVKVVIKGTQLTALTDTAGRFTISPPTDGGTLNIAYSGYKSTQVALNGKDSLKVVLNESVSELAEISVPGYAEDKLTGLAHPLQGWKAFKDYIKNNAFMPNGERGRVKLAFKVSADGSIKGVRIIRGKSDAMNQKAIALLVSGPEWSNQGDMREIKIKIRFRKLRNT